MLVFIIGGISVLFEFVVVLIFVVMFGLKFELCISGIVNVFVVVVLVMVFFDSEFIRFELSMDILVVLLCDV